MQKLRMTYGLTIFALAVIILAPFQFIALHLRLRPVHIRIPILFHHIVVRYAFGWKVTVRGTPEKPNPHHLFRWPRPKEVRGPVLYVSNHNSWSDIVVLGSITPLCFIAKDEISDWPGFGYLAKLQRTIFVKREDKHKAAEQATEMLDRMDSGDALVLFAEGTSSDGNRVLPFKSSLFAVAQMSDIRHSVPPVRVQPISVAFKGLGGLPMSRRHRPAFAWYGDMEFAPHLLDGLRTGPADIEVIFHEPMTLAECGNRKKLANRTHAVISDALAHSLAGRPQPRHAKDASKNTAENPSKNNGEAGTATPDQAA